jgi:nucleotide-binding universal stress UspA family protein
VTGPGDGAGTPDGAGSAESGGADGRQSSRRYTVAVGVSSTSRSPAALRWALQEARAHSGVVIALRAWRPPRPPAATAGRPPLVTIDADGLQHQEQAQLEADVAEVLGPDAGVECRLVHGGPRKTLRSVSRFVDLLVIDAPRRTDIRETPLFARRLVYSASCPVVIMPPAISDQPDTAMISAGKKLGRSLLDAAGSAGRPGVRPGATAD